MLTRMTGLGALERFVQPLYQDVDGVSRYDEVERISRIARRIHTPATAEAVRAFDLLLLFQGLGKWLDRMGNVSRTALAVPGLSETELRRTAASIARLDDPGTPEERALAAAVLIDRGGVRGLAQRFASARREGQSLLDVVREALADAWIPDWVPEKARPWLERRHDARRKFCAAILEEMEDAG